MSETHPIGEGVQALIDRLYEEGVKPGRDEGAQILAEAKREAARLLDEAREEARQIRSDAHMHVEAERKAAREALRVAVRDTVLELREQLQLTFEHHVEKLLSSKLEEEAFLEEVILLIARRAVETEGLTDLSLFVGTGGIAPEKAERFIASVAAKMLETGVTLAPYKGRGIRIVLEGRSLTIDLSETVLAALINRMIAPRYREVFEGIGL